MRGSISRRLWRPGASEAFTLIEVVVALAVVALSLVWLVSASHYATEGTSVAANRTKAALLGAGLAEQMQAGVWSGGAEGSFEEAPALRWQIEKGPVTGASCGVPCRESTLLVSYPGMGHKVERVEFRFLVSSD